MTGSVEVEAYLRGLTTERRAALAAVRSLIRDVVPEATESMRYRMPTYEFKGNPLCAFAARKQYMTLYIHTRLLDKYAHELHGVDRGKECLRFRRLDELPLDTVRRILHEAARVERG